MKFYDCQTAPSPRRARMFIAEKGLDIETIEIDLGKGEQLSEDFRRLNPRCTVPVLELDDGTCLSENAGIASYLEAFAPDPPLLGRTPEEKGAVANWNARVELEGLWPVADAFRNRSKGMTDRAITGPTNYAQIPELAERGHARGLEFYEMLNTRLGESEFVAGDAFSAADITAFVLVDFSAWVKLGPTDAHEHTKRWYDAVKARPSAAL
ncbi:MAG: glutathione S-transferase family protein [Myxococcota bacterium]